MLYEELKQETSNGKVVLERSDGSTVQFSNGGVNGEFEVIITDRQEVPALFNQVGEFSGDYQIKGLPLGADTRVVKLEGKYLVYGNPANGNVMIVKQ